MKNTGSTLEILNNLIQIYDVALFKSCFGVDIFLRTAQQIIQHEDLVAKLNQFVRQVAANEACASSDYVLDICTLRVDSLIKDIAFLVRI